MRITNNMLSQNLLRNLGSAQGRMDDLQDQLSSNLRINKPSDDPVGIQNAMRLQNTVSSVEQWKNNADEAIGYMNSTDSILGDISTVLQRVRELTVEASNGTLTGDDKKKVAIEVDQLAAHLRLTANSQIGSKYIFSGTQTNKELQISEDGFVSEGNDQFVNFEVGNNLSLPISVNGQALFGGGTPEEPSGLFVTLSKLSTALNANDEAGIANALGSIDEGIDKVIYSRADLGARTNRMTSLRDQLDSTSYNLQKNISDIMDADMAKTIVDFKSQENTYKAALSVGAQIIQPSLVDFIR